MSFWWLAVALARPPDPAQRAEALAETANAQWEEGDVVGAWESLEEAARIDPDNAASYLTEQAALLLGVGQAEASLSTAQRALAQVDDVEQERITRRVLASALRATGAARRVPSRRSRARVPSWSPPSSAGASRSRTRRRCPSASTASAARRSTPWARSPRPCSPGCSPERACRACGAPSGAPAPARW